jgi:DNA-binding CsgD family transcriptional regulator
MSLREPDLDKLILAVHSAALEPSGWDQFGQVLLKAFSAESGSALRVASKEHPEPWSILLNFDPDALALYAKDWAPYDVWYRGALRTRRLGTGLVSVDGQLIDDHELKSSPFFNDYLKPLGVRHMIQVCLAGSEPDGAFGKHAALSLYRGPKDGPFSAQSIELLSRLAPHLTAAAKNYWTAHTLRLLTQAQQQALDKVASAVFAIDHRGCVLFLNRLGEEMLQRSTWVRIVKGKLFPVPSVLGGTRVAKALQRLGQGIGATFLISDRVTGAEAHVSMSPIPAAVRVGSLPVTATSLMWITPVLPRRDVGEDIAKLFELTPAERRIVDHLVGGDDLRQAAAALEISIHTARGQLKSIFRKTGRRSQSELMLLAARVAALYSSRPSSIER